MALCHRKVLLDGSSQIRHPLDLALSGPTLYVTDDTRSALGFINMLDDRKNVTWLSTESTARVGQVIAVSAARQSRASKYGAGAS